VTYDAVNRLKTEGSLATLHYTVDDRINTITFGNGEVTTYTYNSRDWPTQILDKYQGTKEMDLNYTYDGTGNVLTLNTETYRYDWLSRLNYSSGPWGTITYAYDQVGNRVRMVQGSTTTVYCYGNYNRLNGYYTTTSCSSPSMAYTYDANGNTATKTGSWTYSYSYANQLTKVVQSGTTVQLNSYDGSGDRVLQTTAASSYTYSYMGLNILYDKNVTGNTTTVTKHFYADGLQVAKMVNGAVYYLHEDALGSVRLVATATVTISFSSNYIPYGSSYAMTGKEVFMYTGKPYDSTTGLYYYGARYYDDSIGRFVTEDSYQGDKNDPLTQNRYIYSRDNPEKYNGPSGHFMHSSIIGESAPESEVTSVKCASGVCTTYTQIVTSGGYVLTSSVTTASVVSSSGTQVDYLSIQSTSMNPSGVITTTTTWAATNAATGQYVARPTISTSINNPTTNNAYATFVGLTAVNVAVSTPYAQGFLLSASLPAGPAAPVIVAAVDYCIWNGGERGMVLYLATTPDPTPTGVAENYGGGFAMALIQFLGGILP
jgi:RHS repeat-associated protein